MCIINVPMQWPGAVVRAVAFYLHHVGPFCNPMTFSSVDIDKTSLYPNFELILLLHLGVMHSCMGHYVGNFFYYVNIINKNRQFDYFTKFK